MSEEQKQAVEDKKPSERIMEIAFAMKHPKSPQLPLEHAIMAYLDEQKESSK